MPVPDFSPGEILTAAVMDSVGLWRVTGCTVSSAGGTAATASNGVITVGAGNTSVTVSNAFSADYDVYFVTYSGGDMSDETAIGVRLGATTSGYYGNFVYGQYNSATVFSAGDNNAARFTYVGGGGGFYDGCSAEFLISNPFLARQTAITSGLISYGLQSGRYTGRLSDTTSYTSFVLSPFSGTLTGGKIRVYGYRN